jgi:NtrC-family two-component system sensor histidine kinase KinB
VSTRTKFLLAQTPLAIALVLFGLVATRALSSLAEQGSTILQDNYRSVLAAERMKDAIGGLQDALSLTLIRGSADADDEPRAERRRFEAELLVQEHNITEPGENEATRRLRELWGAYQEKLDRFVTTDPAGARTLFVEEIAPTAAAIRNTADKILALNHDAMTRKSERARQSAARLNLSLLVAAFVALLGGTLLSVLITNRLVQPLALLTRAVQRIGEGDFDARIGLTGRDELAQLAGHVNGMAARLKQYRQSSIGELLLAQQASQAAIDGLPDPVVVFDEHGAVLAVNRAADALIGVSLEHAGGDPLDALAPPVRAVVEGARDHVLKGKGAYAPKGFEEAICVSPAQDERYFLPRATPMYAEEGDIAGATVMLQDVTRLRRVDELRNDMVATLAHELCTPLTSLRMGIHLCLEQTAGPLTEQQSDLLYASREDCDRLQSTVDELLHLARIQGAPIELDRRATSPRSLVETTIDAHRALAAKHHVQLEADVPAGVGDVRADRERICVVLANLLTHAIHRSAPGAMVSAHVRPVEGAVRFEIVDGGETIAPEVRAALFDRFARSPAGSSTEAARGLSFAKEIVEAHGGEIGFTSEADGCTTFWFTLPSRVAADEPHFDA